MKKTVIFIVALVAIAAGSLFGVKKLKPNLWDKYARKITVPTDHINDEAKLLSYSFEFRLNHFLYLLETEYNIPFEVELVTTSNGYNIDEKIRPIIDRHQQHEKFGLFFLSLTDREFKIYFSPILKEQINEDDMEFLVNLIKPGLTHRRYEEALSQFFSAFIFKVDPTNPILAPRPSPREKQNLKTLLAFLGTLFVLFMLGRRFISRPRLVVKNIENQNEAKFIRFQGYF